MSAVAPRKLRLSAQHFVRHCPTRHPRASASLSELAPREPRILAPRRLFSELSADMEYRELPGSSTYLHGGPMDVMLGLA
jgi:hypothetical protein